MAEDTAAAALERLVEAVAARDRLNRPWRGTRPATELLARAAARQVALRMIPIRVVDAHDAGATVDQIAAAAGYSVPLVLARLAETGRTGKVMLPPRRWYGAHADETPPPDDTPAIELVGGPLDGEWMALIDDHDPPYPDGVALIANRGQYEGGRSMYEHVDPSDGKLHWVCDMA